VSLLWRDSVSLRVGKLGVAWRRGGSRRGPHAAANGMVPYPSDTEEFAAVALACASAVDQALGAGATRRKPKLDVFLDISCTRCVLLPWPGISLSELALLALAASRLRAVFEEVDDTWRIDTVQPRFGKNGLAIAVPGALLAAIAKSALSKPIQRPRIGSALASVLAGHRHRGKRTEALLIAIKDEGGAWVGVTKNSGWIFVRQFPRPWQGEELQTMRTRAAISSGVEPECLTYSYTIDVDAGAGLLQERPNGWQVACSRFLRGHAGAFGPQQGAETKSMGISTDLATPASAMFGVNSRVTGAMLLIAALALAGFTAWQVLIQHRELSNARTLAASVRNAESQAGAAKSSPPDPRQLAEMTGARDAAHSLSLPWNQLLASTESLTNDDIAVLSIVPDPAAQSVTLTIEARHLQAVTDFLRRMHESSDHREPVLLGYQTQQQDPQKPIRARLLFNWAKAAQSP